LAHIDGVTVTNDRYAIGIHAKEVPGYNIIVTAHEHQWVVRIAREAKSLNGGTGTIARQSA